MWQRRLSPIVLVLWLLSGVSGAGASTGDAYEPDDSAADARTIWSLNPSAVLTGLPAAVAKEVPQHHSIHQANDVDWLLFYAVGHDWHEIRVTPEAATLDLKIELYEDQGTRLLASSDWNFAGQSETLSYRLDGDSRWLWIRISAVNYVDSGQPQAYSVVV